MSEALRWTGFAVLAALMAFILRAAHRPAGTAVALAAGAMLFVSALGPIREAAAAMEEMSRLTGVNDGTAQMLIKLVGMAYVTEFAVQACRDAGEEGLAAKASLCGKMLLLSQTLPLVQEIGALALSLSP